MGLDDLGAHLSHGVPALDSAWAAQRESVFRQILAGLAEFVA